mmetsp:Transcript_40781/g.48987  ORF Transcript_40781/g.48987 Transcript_40781/m.48987 type:complete len:323 (+) Transcript_40781:221-1189(+)
MRDEHTSSRPSLNGLGRFLVSEQHILLVQHRAVADVYPVLVAIVFVLTTARGADRITIVIFAEALLVVPSEATVSYYPSVGELQLAVGCYFEPVLFDVALVPIVQTVGVIFFFVIFCVLVIGLVIRDILPFLVVHLLHHIHLRVLLVILFFHHPFLQHPTGQKLLIGTRKVVERRKLGSIDTLFVPDLGMPPIDHVMLDGPVRLKGPQTIQTIMPQFDFFGTVSQHTFHVDAEFSIRQKEPVFSLHPCQVGLRGCGAVGIKEANARIDGGRRGWHDRGFGCFRCFVGRTNIRVRVYWFDRRLRNNGHHLLILQMGRAALFLH